MSLRQFNLAYIFIFDCLSFFLCLNKSNLLEQFLNQNILINNKKIEIISASDTCMKTVNYINEKVIIHTSLGHMLFCSRFSSLILTFFFFVLKKYDRHIRSVIFRRIQKSFILHRR
jgi:hypothetical protein